MELQVLTVARYNDQSLPHPTLFLAKGSYSDVKPHRWEEFTMSGLKVGDAVLSGKATKQGKDWHIEKPFVVSEGGQERVLKISQEEIEEFCNLALWNAEEFEKRLCGIAGVEGRIERARRIAGIAAIIKSERVEYLEFQGWEESGKVVPKKISVSDLAVGDWKITADFEKVGAKKWAVERVEAKKKVEVNRGVIEEKREVIKPALEIKLSDAINRLVKGVFSVGKKDKHGVDLGKREIEKAIEEMSRKEIHFGNGRDMVYRSESENLIVFAGRFLRNPWWRVKMKELENLGSESRRVEELTTLMEEAMETGDESNLVEFCKELLGQGKSRSFNGGKKPCR